MPWFLLLLAFTVSWARATLPLELVAGPGADTLTLRFAKLPDASKPLLIVTTSSGPSGAGMVPFGQNKTGIVKGRYCLKYGFPDIRRPLIN